MKLLTSPIAFAATLVLAFAASACQVEDGPTTSTGTSAVKVAPTESIAPSQAAVPPTAPTAASAEAPLEPAAVQPSGCCGSQACAQAKAAEGACPCRAAAQAAALADMPNCGGDEH